MTQRRKLSIDEKQEIGTECAGCGSKENLQYHHIVPISLGGRDSIQNMVCLCAECHSKAHSLNNAISYKSIMTTSQKREEMKSRGEKWNYKSEKYIDWLAKIDKYILKHYFQFGGTKGTEEVTDALKISQSTLFKRIRILVSQGHERRFVKNDSRWRIHKLLEDRA